MSKLLGAALRQARQAKKLTQDDVAKHMSVTRSAVGQWESGDTAPSTLNLLKLCAHLEIEVSAALDGLVQLDPDAHWPPRKSDNPIPRADFEAILEKMGTGDVHIFRSSAEGGTGFRVYNEIIGSLSRPPGLVKTRGGVATWVVGGTMAPRYNEGDLIFSDAGRTPSLNDYVLIRMVGNEEDGWSDCYLRQLIGRDDKNITVRQLCPDKTAKLEISKVEAIDRIYPWNEIIIG